MPGTLEHLTHEAPRWHPSQIPQQHQLAKLACGRVAALLRASPKWPSSSPFRGNSFSLLAISLCHHPELVVTGEGRSLDWPVTQQCHFHTWVPCCKEMCHRQVALIGADQQTDCNLLVICLHLQSIDSYLQIFANLSERDCRQSE